MFTNSDSSQVVVTGVGPVCRAACGAAALETLEPAHLAIPAAGDDWFDAPRFLGPRGFKYMTPATRYMLAAAGLALDHAAIPEGTYAQEQRGVMVGSNFAVAAVHDAMDRTILAESADALSPMEAANFSINLAASYVSLKHGCKGFNVCFTSAMVAGLEAVVFGANAIRGGRSGLLIAGATEGVPPAPVGPLVGGNLPNGGACAITMERASAAAARGARVYGTFAAGVLAFSRYSNRGDNDSTRLETVVERAVGRMNLPAGTFHLYRSAAHAGFNDQVADIVRRGLADRGIAVRDASTLASYGALFTVSPLLQLAYALSRQQNALIVTTSPFGHIAIVAFTAAADGTNGNGHSTQDGKVTGNGC